jgi:hypothetical protein
MEQKQKIGKVGSDYAEKNRRRLILQQQDNLIE